MIGGGAIPGGITIVSRVSTIGTEGGGDCGNAKGVVVSVAFWIMDAVSVGRSIAGALWCGASRSGTAGSR